MHILGNYSGYYYPISSDYFWHNRQAGQVVTPSQVDYSDSTYYLGPPMWKPSDAKKKPINFWLRPPTAADVQSGTEPSVPSEYYASAGTMTLYQHANFEGKTLSLSTSCFDLTTKDKGDGKDWGDTPSSIVINGGRWYAFQHKNFEGDKYGPFTDTGNVKGRYNYSGNFKDDAISSIYKVHDDYTFDVMYKNILDKVKKSVESHGKVFTTDAANFVRDALMRLNKYADASFCQHSGSNYSEWNEACPATVLKQWANKQWSGVAEYMDGAVNRKYQFKVVAGNALIPEGEPGGGKVGGGGYVITPEDVARNTLLPKGDNWVAWNPPGFDKYDIEKYVKWSAIGLIGLVALVVPLVIIVKVVKSRGGDEDDVIIIEEE